MTNKLVGIAIFVIIGLSGAVTGLYIAAHAEVPRETIYIVRIVIYALVVRWLHYDTKNNLGGMRDHFILALLWPFVLPYHLWKTRRFRGVVVIFAALFVGFASCMLVEEVLIALLHKA